TRNTPDLRGSCSIGASASESISDSAKALVMIVCVVVLRAAAGDDAPRPATFRPRRWYGVFTIVTLLSWRQAAFAVAKHRAVPAIRERSAALDQSERTYRLRRQRPDPDLGQRDPVAAQPQRR